MLTQESSQKLIQMGKRQEQMAPRKGPTSDFYKCKQAQPCSSEGMRTRNPTTNPAKVQEFDRAPPHHSLGKLAFLLLVGMPSNCASSEGIGKVFLHMLN